MIEHGGVLVGSTARKLWDFRVELTVLGVLLGYFLGGSMLLPVWAGLLQVALLAGLIAWPKSCDWLVKQSVERMQKARLRRRVERAAADSDFPGLRVERVASTLPGELISVRIPRGQTVEKLDRSAKAMAGCLRVEDVRVIHDSGDRSHAELSIIRRNAFERMEAMHWPLLNAEEIDIRKPFPFGLDEYGRMVHVSLLSRNMLMGGAPGAGKSASLRVIAAAAALDPKVKLWMMDAKTGGAEFVHWAPAAEQVVRGRDLDAAVEMLARLEERIEARGQEIVARGEVFVSDDMEIDVLMIDELPQFTRSFETDTKAQQSAVKAIRHGIWRLIALGRWAGMITVLSAQKPTADIVPSEFRDLIDLKYALHCNTRQMSDAILGDGSGGDTPVNAAEIPTGQPGVGYLLADDGARKMRSFFLSHRDALEVASRAASRQLDDELQHLA